KVGPAGNGSSLRWPHRAVSTTNQHRPTRARRGRTAPSCSARRACAQRCDHLFLQISNDANGGTLRVLDYGKASHFGDIPRLHPVFPAELLCLFRARIDIVYRHVAEPGRGHSFGVRWYRHYTALAHVGSTLPHNGVGEVGHWKILSSPPEQLCIKLSRRARISGQEFIPAKLAMFGLCGVHIWVLFFLSLLSFCLGTKKN